MYIENVRRSSENPLITPADLEPTLSGWEIIGVLNPGAFEFEGSTGLLMRVAERPPQEKGKITVAYFANDEVELRTFNLDDPLLDASDQRMVIYDGTTYLTSISHLRLAWSQDGTHFAPGRSAALISSDTSESYGIEDARVTIMDATYHLTYSAVSERGVCGGYATTSDWKHFNRHGAVLPPPNKDIAVFSRTIGGTYRMLHRPSDEGFGGINMWIAESTDLVHWGNHRFLAAPRKGMWDCVRIGAGAAPLETPDGWLEIYHGADENGRYCLGVMLFDLNEPSILRARSNHPIMEPVERYEREGFYGDCIFTNGQIVWGDEIDIYYGASDTVICKATISIDAAFDALR